MARATGGDRGMSLVEIMIVVALLGLLCVLLINSYQSWAEKYRVESALKEMFADLMDARARAIQKSRAHFVTVSTAPARYRIFEDTSPAPDGNGILEAADGTIRTVVLRYPVTVLPAGMAQVNFNRDGLVSTDTGNTGVIRLTSPVAADYDCITLGPTRIKMGQFDGATNACVER